MPDRVTIAAWNHEEIVLEMQDLLICNEDQLRSNVTLAACTLVSDNQILRLPEWIEYNREIGFELFYIYLDSPNVDVYRKLLESYMQQHPGLIEIVPFYFETGRRAQVAHQFDCAKRMKGIAKFVATFDVDEFFQPMGDWTLLSFLSDKFDNDQKLAGIYIPSVSFASSNNSNPPDGYSLFIETFTWRMPTPTRNRQHKGIFMVDRVAYSHVHYITSGEKQINADYNKEIRMNHYRYPHHSVAWNSHLAVEDKSLANLFSEPVKTELRNSGYFIF